MKISPDDNILAWLGPLPINATLAYTWLVMAILVLGSYLITRRLQDIPKLTRWQNLLEILVSGLREQIRQASCQEPGPYLPFIGTLFLFIATANMLAIVPGYIPPTASLSTTTALALAVFAAVPLYGVARNGLGNYLANYLEPTLIMLPLNILGELSRTLALAVRLYGNMMNGTIIGAILLGIAPLFFPIVLQFLGLITGIVQAYIFAVLAMVFIASAQSTQDSPTQNHRSGD